MDDERVLTKALLRYQIISPILAADPPRGGKYKMIEELASRQWVLEEGKLMSPQPETIRYWLRLYRAGGFEALAQEVEKRVASVYDRQVQEELAALAELFLVHDAQ